MSAFTSEIAKVVAAVTRAYPGHAEGIYAVPWYLLLGEIGSGRSTALHAMNLTWSRGAGPLQTGVPQQLCTYWMPDEAVFVEPEAAVLGPRRNPAYLKALCEALRATRPREAMDGIILIISIAAFIDLDEQGVDRYAEGLRRYLVEIGQALTAHVPVYVILSGYDALWGFAQVFQWSSDRTREEPWGFTLSSDTATRQALPRINEELVGLHARLEACCLAKLASEDPPEQRTVAFQHLVEARALMDKLRVIFRTLAMENAFERAPWLRAVGIGSAVPGTGGRLRVGMARFRAMGVGEAPMTPAGARRGGMPIHAFMKTVVLPEREIVPLRVRFRDDKLTVIGLLLGVLLWVGALSALVMSLSAGGCAHR
jgi:type VI secretion system protein ImpL